MTTPSVLAEWFALATDTTRPLLERQLAASNVVAAADALAAAVKAEEKEQRERDGLPRLALLPAMTMEGKS